MSIYEYDEAAHMSQVREEGVEYGREEGRKEGRNEGEWLRLISQIRKKLGKNIEAAQIADMLEEDEKVVKELIQLIDENVQRTNEELAKLYLDASSDRINVSQ